MPHGVVARVHVDAEPFDCRDDFTRRPLAPQQPGVGTGELDGAEELLHEVLDCHPGLHSLGVMGEATWVRLAPEQQAVTGKDVGQAGAGLVGGRRPWDGATATQFSYQVS